MTKRLYIKTFGCQMNVYDSAKMVDLLRSEKNLETTEDPEQADVILLNTCSIREKAQEKVFSDLGRVRAIKESRPEVLIGVGGCVASQEGASILKRAPYVDIIFGPQTLHRLADMIDARRESGKPQVDISFPEIEKFDRLPPPHVAGVSAFVSIMEGCSKYCSFCVVPYTRGEEFSRRLPDVLTEVALLAEQGVREITLLGQNVNAYRVSWDSGEADFAVLLTLVHQIPGIERIRFTTSHPKEFSDRLIACFGQLPKLAAQVHLPVQSGSDRILALMKRGYTVLEYKSIVRKLRRTCPAISLTSDFIVGFPGETAEDFNKTLQLMDELEFDLSYSFIYSPRPGTPAASLTETTSALVKHERLTQLQQANRRETDRISQKMKGTQQRLLVERGDPSLRNSLCGRTDNNRLVHFQGSESLVRQLVDVTVLEARTHTLQGVLVGVAEAAC